MERLLCTTFSIGSDFLELMPARMQPVINSALIRARASRKAVTQDFETTDSTGRLASFETVCDPLIDTDRLVCMVMREVTAEKLFQKKITQLARDHANLIENANAVIFSIDSREYITEWNTQCARLSQHTKNEVLTKKISSFVDNSVASEFALFLSSIYSGNPGSNFELLLVTKDYRVINLLVNATPNINADGRVIGILFVGQDITELSEYKSSLERIVKDRTSKLKGALEKEKELVEIKNRFVSMASHELRIPLSMISSSAKYVRSKTNDLDALEKVDVIEKQIAHMRSLIEDVLTAGKTDLTKIKASRNRIDIVAFVHKLCEEVSVNASHSHEIIFNTTPPIPDLESDEKLLRSVFLNILSNALKFSPGQNQIEVSINPIEDGVEISVRDYGIGITETDLAKIFDPFTRGSNAAQIKGTGLGLSIAKRAVEVLNGTIVISSSTGVGTVIKVQFRNQV